MPGMVSPCCLPFALRLHNKRCLLSSITDTALAPHSPLGQSATADATLEYLCLMAAVMSYIQQCRYHSNKGP